MRDRIPLLAGLSLLAIAIFLGAAFVADGIRDRDGSNEVITVTGSAKKQIVSDFVIWNASIASQRETAAAAAKELETWTKEIRTYLTSNGVEADELTIQPISTETLTGDSDGGDSRIVGYRLTRSFEVRSPRVDDIRTVADRSSELIARGIPFAPQPPQYVFTKLADIRPELLAAATKDAQNRGEVLVEATGAELGSLRGVDVGVFQVTSPNSVEVSDYGVYDTATVDKEVTAVVNVTFALDS
jgi:uncharacterized protein